MVYTFKSWANIVFIFFLLAAGLGSNAQETPKGIYIKEKGFITGAGKGINRANVPEGFYTPVFFIAHVGIGLKKSEAIKRAGNAIYTIYFEPQVNPVFVISERGRRNNIEFGVNVGVKHMFPIYKNLYSILALGVGPHYTSVRTEIQKRGFLFSDNFSGGLSWLASNNVAINLFFRLRHLSNGDTMKPNKGINTFNYHIGVSKIIK